MTTAAAEHRWRARPALAVVLRVALLAVPLVASSAVVYGLARWQPETARTGWGVAVLLLTGLLVAVALERATRRLLPITLLLKLSMIFPDRAPSRLRLARTAASRRSRHELLWTGSGLRPTSTSDLVLALIGALGAHDRRTRGHCERVRLLCDVLAVELGLDDDARDRLRWSALLHDVGKVEVSSRILNKPSRLDPAEFDRVRLHPAAGATLAAPLLPWLGTWGEGILDHHERYDGSGYPNGKVGEQISEAGRLIAVIDAFETMTAARPYKKAMATRAAREELARCAGTHFDPVYVRAFLAVSLPRLLWAMGPLSFLLQLPFLSSIAQTGVRAGAAVPQAAGALAAGAAGAAVIAGGGVTTAGATPAPQAAPPSSAVGTVDAGPAPAANEVTRPRDLPVPSSTPLPATTPAPAAPAAPAAPRPMTAFPGPGGSTDRPSPAAGTSSPTAAPAAPAPDPRADEDHPAIRSGPPPTTTSRTATFELVPGTAWECQLIGAADGEPSRWKPCEGTFTVTVVRDGEQVLRVRDAETRDTVDTWEWTVTAPGDGAKPRVQQKDGAPAD